LAFTRYTFNYFNLFKVTPMKRIFYTAALLVLVSTISYAQSSPVTIMFKKDPKQGLAITLPVGTDVAEGTILQKLKENGYTPETKGALFWKKNKIDGFYVFNGVQLPSLNNQTLDLYFKVDPKSRRDKNNSNLSLLVSKGYDNFVTGETDTATYGAVKRFLDSFDDKTQTFKLNLDIKAQEETVKKAEEKLAAAISAEAKMNSQIEDLQAKIRTSKADQENITVDIENQKRTLEDLKTQAAGR